VRAPRRCGCELAGPWPVARRADAVAGAAHWRRDNASTFPLPCYVLTAGGRSRFTASCLVTLAPRSLNNKRLAPRLACGRSSFRRAAGQRVPAFRCAPARPHSRRCPQPQPPGVLPRPRPHRVDALRQSSRPNRWRRPPGPNPPGPGPDPQGFRRRPIPSCLKRIPDEFLARGVCVQARSLHERPLGKVLRRHMRSRHEEDPREPTERPRLPDTGSSAVATSNVTIAS
jgi:hypothetical protein